MIHLLMALNIIAGLFLIVVVLLQSGKGADMGAAFGGGSATVFGPSGAGDFLTKLTAATAATFMISSLFLAVLSAKQTSLFDKTPEPVAEAPAAIAPTPSAEVPGAVAPTPTAEVGDTAAQADAGTAKADDAAKAAATATAQAVDSATAAAQEQAGQAAADAEVPASAPAAP